MARLLIVEDEERLAHALLVGLRDEGYVVDWMGDGEEGLWAASGAHHDAILLDVRLPKLSGVDLCRRLRSEGSRIPILMLTACDATEAVVAGLDAGADDYVTKPFQFAELLARLRALLRRGSAGGGARLQVGDLVIDTAARSVHRGDKQIHLTHLEYRLLEAMARHSGAVQSRARLIAAVWEDELGPDSNVLEVLISNLRRKIDRDAPMPLIHTQRGVGYGLSEAPER